MSNPLGVRWTIGDVNPAGFEALGLSIWGARRLFGPESRYVVCVNTVSVDEARRRTGDVPDGIEWRDNTAEVPAFLRPHLDASMAQGVAWKLAPLRIFTDRYELALDNDCILWDIPEAIRAWLADLGTTRPLVAEDVVRAYGQFEDLCGPRPINLGIRGLPPAYDNEAALARILARKGAQLTSGSDEQGLQVAAIVTSCDPLVVSIEEVSICSPFPPHLPHLGTCGVHFVGINAKNLAGEINGRPITEYLREHWERHRSALIERVRPGAACQTL
jgi:hypothetical protein